MPRAKVNRILTIHLQFSSLLHIARTAPSALRTGRILMPKLSKLFSNRSIASKLATMTIVGAICMALVATSVLLVGRNQLIVERTQKAQAIVDSVWQIADGLQKAAAAGQMTDQEARTRFLTVASLVWYENHTNYVFIYD